ncbi:malto-oligosyltrehalose trehalohydrolase [Sphingomonas metalli]|uniref:Malto-oligosyltrehalose trehalohydrolase n=1 Tax=Sphingomonas metalli TaxID=1779358 RepID=A0A916WRX1_9SPHN|nr:malto-oligosyltrehalose trehalohydrolase [Sphingomonas metalli]GGB23876.1 malto-oligosyltrehalose trehalohydrolase [Sphingomonas metalli]
MTSWGPTIEGDATAFRLWAPDADAVTLEVDGRDPLEMQAAGEGWYEATAPVGAGARYRFRIGDMAVPDPAARAQDGGVHGWSVVIDHEAYDWRSADWAGRPWEAMVIEEMHVGLEGGFAGLAARLPEIAGSGVTAIELMPVNAFAGTRNWGYDGVLPYAPAESYGTPDELRALVDRAHGLGVSVFLDVVYNHFGPDGNYLGAYAKDFFHPDVKTPWGGAVAVDADPPRRFFIDNALMWLRDYRIDGLRFDAVHAIANDGFLDAMAAEIRASLDRPVHLVLENERNDADRLAPGRYDAQWNDDFHNVLHVLLTGERDAYYADFAEEPEARLARCLTEGFIYQGEGSVNHDGKPRGTPSAHLPPTAFVAFLQNHDQIGNRALGERLTRLTDPQRLRAATLLLLLGPQIPLIFAGDRAGSEAPFLFFTDFHDELADAVREGRRGEFAKFAAFADPDKREAIPDPNAADTFERSRVTDGPDADGWRRFYAELLALRHAHIVPNLKGATSAGAEVLGDKAVIARWRMGDGQMLAIALNLGEVPVAVPDGEPLAAVGTPGEPASAAAWLA